ncbi:MAG: hypothetical protein Tsb002_07080 [Wenzhouxiangellaceae bacterium]
MKFTMQWLACLCLSLFMGLTVATAGQSSLAGAWAFVGENGPGSGLMMSRNGQRMMVALITYDESGAGVWSVASGRLSESAAGAEDLFREPLQRVEGGACLECPFEPGVLVDTQREIELRFISQNQAWLTLDPAQPDAQAKLIRKLNVGQRAILSDPFPDLSGSWLFATQGVEPAQSLTATLTRQPDRVIAGQRSIVYRSLETFNETEIEIECDVEVVQAEQRIGQCRLFDANAIEMGIAAGADFDHQRIILPRVGDSGRWVGFRLERGQGEFGNLQSPFEGAWSFTDEQGPGSGLMLVRNGPRVMAVLTTYAQSGEPVWRIASGSLQFREDQADAYFSAPLAAVTGGSCLDCPFEPGQILPLSQQLEIRFDSATSGELSLQPDRGQQRFRIRKLNVGARLALTDPLPELAGDWVYVMDFRGRFGFPFQVNQVLRSDITSADGLRLLAFNSGLECLLDQTAARDSIRSCAFWDTIPNPTAQTPRGRGIDADQMVLWSWSGNGLLHAFRLPR